MAGSVNLKSTELRGFMDSKKSSTEGKKTNVTAVEVELPIRLIHNTWLLSTQHYFC